ncbi:MAG: chemotaxis protein CheA [Gemmatimonadaceae bacterium]
MDPAKYAALFGSESRENLSAITQALLALERQPESREPIDALFRAMHTIKGMAGVMGYAAVTELAHEMESLLMPMRDGRRQLTAPLIELLFSGTDALEEAIDLEVAGKARVGGGLAAEAVAGVLLRVREATSWEEMPAGATESAPLARASQEGTGGAKGETQAAQRADDAWAATRGGRARQPSQVRIDIRRLDALVNLVGELVIARGRLSKLAGDLGHGELDDVVSHAARLVGELQDAVMASRLVPVWQIFDRFPRVVRDGARALGKEIDFVLEGREIEVDRSLLDQMGDPLVHLLRNAVDHGLESPDEREAAGKPRTGRLVLSAARDRAAVVIRVSDDGRGIDRTKVLRKAQALGLPEGQLPELSDEQLLRVIARPGFSTATQVTDFSGRGVGIDAVVARVRGLGGSMEVRTALGEGTSLTLRLPATLAIVPALLTRVASETYALPLTHVQETLHLTPDVVRAVRGRDVLVLRDEFLPLVRLRERVQLPARDAEGSQVVVIEVADRRSGVVVDQLIGQQEIVVKAFDVVRGAASCVTGATILSDGSPALILEASSLL